MPFVYSIDFVVDSFPCGIMCRVWNLIVSVPDIAFLSFQANKYVYLDVRLRKLYSVLR